MFYQSKNRESTAWSVVALALCDVLLVASGFEKKKKDVLFDIHSIGLLQICVIYAEIVDI